MAAPLTHETFTAFLNTSFKVRVDETQQIDLQLDTVSDLIQSARQEQFSIVFRGPNETFLMQGLRRFDHEGMGQFELFIVPIGQDSGGYSYEAVFNRARSPNESSDKR